MDRLRFAISDAAGEYFIGDGATLTNQLTTGPVAITFYRA
jgi:hypothetical protein